MTWDSKGPPPSSPRSSFAAGFSSSLLSFPSNHPDGLRTGSLFTSTA